MGLPFSLNTSHLLPVLISLGTPSLEGRTDPPGMVMTYYLIVNIIMKAALPLVSLADIGHLCVLP